MEEILSCEINKESSINGGSFFTNRQIKQKLLSTFGGDYNFEWDPKSEISPLGHLAFFIEFLKTSHLYESWISDAPLVYRSNNCPKIKDILGSGFLSILSGQKRYSHLESLRGDKLSASLLGMNKVVSSDSLRRSFANVNPVAAEEWLHNHLSNTYSPLLTERWILDVDVSVKVLYGNQEAAVKGYNPQKPGRPSHTIHSYFMGEIKLCLDAEIQPGNHSAGSYSCPTLWKLINTLPPNKHPELIRGDCGYGFEKLMLDCETRNLNYLFRLKRTSKVKQLIKVISPEGIWLKLPSGKEAIESTIRLTGWSKSRRIIIIREKQTPSKKILKKRKSKKKQRELFDLNDISNTQDIYKYRCIVTSLLNPIDETVQLYNDRAGMENIFDELFHQWGWGGFVTKDLKRSQIWARMIALIYNWWTIYTRLFNPKKHQEAITSKPTLLTGVARITTHSRNNTIKITSLHSKANSLHQTFEEVLSFLKDIQLNATQFSKKQQWMFILSKAFVKYLKFPLIQHAIQGASP